jgi:hypothetical protein
MTAVEQEATRTAVLEIILVPKIKKNAFSSSIMPMD